MLAYLMMKSLLMPACPQTHHPSLCPRHTMPVTSGCKTLSISASEELRWGRGGHVPMKKAQKHNTLSKYSDYSACFPSYHLTSQEGKAWALQRHNCQPSLSCLGLAGTGAGTWATASTQGTGPPLLPQLVCTPAWPTFRLAVGPKASRTPLGISGIGMSAWFPSPFHLLLLAAVGSGASLFWSLCFTTLDKGSGPIPAPPHGWEGQGSMLDI